MKVIIGIAVFFLVSSANAALIARANGLVYDSDLDITWLADANHPFTSGYDEDGLMTYQESVVWANQLEFGGYDDWRLTQALPSATAPYCTAQFYCDDTEFAHLYYDELEGAGPRGTRLDRTGDHGPFVNIQTQYWSGLVVDETRTMNFHFDAGYQISHPNDNQFAAWAVRSGDVAAVPIPAAAWLFCCGLLGLVGIAKRNAHRS